MDFEEIKKQIKEKYRMSKSLSDEALLQWATDAKEYYKSGKYTLAEACEKSASEFKSYNKDESYVNILKNSASSEFKISMLDYIINNETMLLSQK